MSILQTGIQHTVPVTPTDESQADTGIDHPLVSCDHCDTIWRSHDCSRCPRCARCVGIRTLLGEDMTSDLIAAVSLLDEEHIARGPDYTMWEFSNILHEFVSWYDENCRETIQACYEVVRRQPMDPKMEFAVEFFACEYLYAPEPEMLYRVEWGQPTPLSLEDDYYEEDYRED